MADIKFYGGYQVYSESGVDLTLLRENLKLTPTQRWEKNSRSLAVVKLFDGVCIPERSRRKENEKESPMFDPSQLLQELEKHHVKYVVIGGLAMRAHGSCHVTDDMDICYSRDPENIAALVAALANCHPYLRGAPKGLPFRFDAATVQAGLNFTLETDFGAFDALGEVSGIGNYAAVVAQSMEANVASFRIRVLTIDGLMAAKKAAGRNKDKDHIRELEELKRLNEIDEAT